MPIYEYSCKQCQHRFEALVRGGKIPKCPECGHTELERLMSLPAVKSEATHDLAMRAAKRRDTAQAKERVDAQLKYEQSHND
jgi:putative FmdB family regulatory protein